MPLRIAVLALFATLLSAQETKPEKLSPYYPTPEMVVEKMLQMGGLKRGEKLIDIGSGDGRIVISAAVTYGAKGEGVELDGELWKRSVDKARVAGVQDSVRFIHGDALLQDYSSADLITVYLLPVFNAKLRPILERQLKKGTRVVAHDFEVAGWTPVKSIVIDDDESIAHTLYLYIR
jgi:ubiquinone/menaquinone biosynthesis C-methylase UbiE